MKKLIYIGLTIIAATVAFGESAPIGKGQFGKNKTAFVFPDHPETAEWYNGYMQSFFTNRVDIGTPLFPKEYLALSDSWMNGAFWDTARIQEHTKNELLNAQMDHEGYLFAQQHGGTSHDHGWPFPHWIQVPPGDNGSEGVTAGWHFYDNPQAWEIVYSPAKKMQPEHFSEKATEAWTLQGLESKGINQEKSAWELKTTEGFPSLTSPEGIELDSFNSPFVQIRWNKEGKSEAFRPYIEWQREGDSDWSAARRMNFYPDWLRDYSKDTGMFHSMIPLYKHSEWNGKITRLRICMSASDAPPETFYIRSIFTHWDTRHLVNNAIYVKAVWEYFRWTGDTTFLQEILPRLRIAMRYMMKEGHGLELNHIRCTWHGHDGRAGYTVNADGSKTFHVGHGKGGNYWDLLPLGWDDMYTTTHYYASLLAMAQIEQVIAENPGWAMPRGFQSLEPDFLREHAAQVKVSTNQKFWNDRDGRFVGCIDADGIPHDYGFTFINLEAIHYGIANETNAAQIMEWIDGKRDVEGDTSVGSDIYAYHLAPRATTKRNIEWYAHVWYMPESLPFGGQVQDGGAVLGFSFYDVMSRITTLGPDNAWARLMEIRDWDEEVAAYGGYRKYYGDGKGSTTLQGGGSAGGIGIDAEFTESSMLSAVIPLGFMGLRPDGEVLHIEPNLPAECPSMAVRNLRYQGVRMDVAVQDGRVNLRIYSRPSASFTIRFGDQEKRVEEAGRYILKQ